MEEVGGRGEEGVGRKVGKGGSRVKTKQSETPKKKNNNGKVTRARTPQKEATKW